MRAAYRDAVARGPHSAASKITSLTVPLRRRVGRYADSLTFVKTLGDPQAVCPMTEGDSVPSDPLKGHNPALERTRDAGQMNMSRILRDEH